MRQVRIFINFWILYYICRQRLKYRELLLDPVTAMILNTAIKNEAIKPP